MVFGSSFFWPHISPFEFQLGKVIHKVPCYFASKANIGHWCNAYQMHVNLWPFSKYLDGVHIKLWPLFIALPFVALYNVGNIYWLLVILCLRLFAFALYCSFSLPICHFYLLPINCLLSSLVLILVYPLLTFLSPQMLMLIYEVISQIGLSLEDIYTFVFCLKWSIHVCYHHQHW